MKKITLFLSAMLFSVMSFAADNSATISFSNEANRTVLNDSQQVWEQNGIVVTNDKAASSTNVANYYNPVRFYQGSSVKIKCTLGNIKKIEVTCGTYTGKDYPSDLVASVGSEATADGLVVTITPTASSDTYTIEKLTAQVRVAEITVIYGDEGNGNGNNPGTGDAENGADAAGTITFDADVDKGNAGTDSNNAAAYTITKEGVTMTVSSGILGSFNNEAHYRIYKNQTLTLTSTVGDIVSVEFTCTANDDAKYGPGCFAWSTGEYSYSGAVGTWTGSDSEIVFTASSNQVRASQVVVKVAQPTALDNVFVDKAPVKVLKNGQLLIICGENTYNVLGAAVK